MKGYKCDLKWDELKKLREDFWVFNENNDRINLKTWNTIRQATLMEDGKN